jgi:hypothetical protein
MTTPRNNVRTVVCRALDHVVDAAVEVGVDDPRRLVLGLEAPDLRLEQAVVVRGEVVELLEASEAVVVGGVGGAVDGEVDGEAADGQHAGHHDVRRAHRDQFLHAHTTIHHPSMVGSHVRSIIRPRRRRRWC